MSTELLLVFTVIILGILAAIAYIAFNRWFDDSNAAEKDSNERNDRLLWRNPQKACC